MSAWSMGSKLCMSKAIQRKESFSSAHGDLPYVPSDLVRRMMATTVRLKYGRERRYVKSGYVD